MLNPASETRQRGTPAQGSPEGEYMDINCSFPECDCVGAEVDREVFLTGSLERDFSPPEQPRVLMHDKCFQTLKRLLVGRASFDAFNFPATTGA